MENKRDSFFLKNKKEKTRPEHNKKQTYKDKRQEKFDENREDIENGDKESKKPFDKKAYRIKKYSKKYKLEQWEEQRKKKMLRNLQKDLQKDSLTGSYKSKTFDEDTVDSNQEFGKFVRHPDFVVKEKPKVKDPFAKAKEHFDKVKKDKIEKQQQIVKAKEERMQKIQEYKKKKNERFKKLSKKNKKGQPVMSGRLELLLEKIQKGK